MILNHTSFLSIEDAALLSPGRSPGDRRCHTIPTKQSPERTPLDASAPDAREGNEASRIAPSGLWVIRASDLHLTPGFHPGLRRDVPLALVTIAVMNPDTNFLGGQNAPVA
jgi:hypothetical protein